MDLSLLSGWCYCLRHCWRGGAIRSTANASANRMVLVATLSGVLLLSLAGMAGVVVYSYYSHLGCGPLAAGHIYSPNQVDN